MSYYPAMLDLRDKKVLFIGGGWETQHKVRGLLEAGARVTVVSPFEHPELEHLLNAGQIVWHKRGFQPGDLEGFMLCVSHPVNRLVNAMIAKEARERGIWLNAVDDPGYCDFILPSVHRQGDLVISVSTSGAAPALGVRIKQKLAREYGPEYGEYLKLLRWLRPVVLQTYPDDFEARKSAWYRMIDSQALELVRIGEVETAREILLRALYRPPQPVVGVSLSESNQPALLAPPAPVPANAGGLSPLTRRGVTLEVTA